MEETFFANTVEEIQTLGNTLAKELKPGDIVLLFGEMGSGKTTLTKGILSYFNIGPNTVVSPTFSLMQYYEILDPKSEITNIVHVDTYRLNDEQELIDIGITDYLGEKDTVCIIEWPEKLTTLLQNKKTISVKIEIISEQQRKITVEN
jgi:tRNA threonylcarbamoyladenosine biosynthesis protein TsaE